MNKGCKQVCTKMWDPPPKYEKDAKLQKFMQIKTMKYNFLPITLAKNNKILRTPCADNSVKK